MGRGKRRAKTSRLPLSVDGGRRLAPGEATLETIMARLPELVADLGQGHLQLTIEAVRPLAPPVRRRRELKPLWQATAACCLSDLDGELVEGAARRYLQRLQLVERTTPAITAADFRKRLRHLRDPSRSGRTLCGRQIGPRWMSQAARGVFAQARQEPGGFELACDRCAQAAERAPGLVPAAFEGPRFPVLGDEAVQGLLARASATVQESLQRPLPRETVNAVPEVLYPARQVVLEHLYRRAALEAWARGADWIIDSWLQGRHVRPILAAHYAGAIPLPDAEALAQLLPSYGDVHFFVNGDGADPLYSLLADVALSHWPDAVRDLVRLSRTLRYPPGPLDDLAERAARQGLIDGVQIV